MAKPLGFAKFSSPRLAFDAVQLINNTRYEGKTTMKAEMAKKNLHTRRRTEDEWIEENVWASGLEWISADDDAILRKSLDCQTDKEQGEGGFVHGGFDTALYHHLNAFYPSTAGATNGFPRPVLSDQQNAPCNTVRSLHSYHF
jgi:hypothetical protein